MPSNSFDMPSSTEGVDSKGHFVRSWIGWFFRVNTVAQTIQQYGPTADRPTANLWPGRFYYDETLGFPVWVHSVNPTVWHDGAGNPV